MAVVHSDDVLGEAMGVYMRMLTDPFNSRKSFHSRKVLRNLNKMKDEGIACNFGIKVGRQSFPIHLCVFMANSTYFERHEEDDRNCITMDQLTEEGVDGCVSFMYTGEIEVRSLTKTQNILEASHYLYIDEVKKICIKYLRENLNLQTCVNTFRLFHLCGGRDHKSVIDRFITSHFEDVICLDEFKKIKIEDLRQFLSILTFQDSKRNWNAIKNWIAVNEDERMQYLSGLLDKLLKKRSVTLNFLLGIWSHEYTLRGQHVKPILIKGFLKCLNRKQELEVESCYALKKIAIVHDSEDSDSLNLFLNDFLARNLDKVFQNEEFATFSFEDLTSIFLNEHLRCKSEAKKWEISIGWVKHDESRTGHLSELMELLDFTKITAGYILDDIRNEPLVAISPECMEILKQAASFCTKPDILVMMDSGTRHGRLETFDVERGHRSLIRAYQHMSHDLHPLFSLFEPSLQYIGIVSVHRELYVLHNTTLTKFSGGKWHQQASLPGRLREYAKMTAFRGRIYLVSRSTMSYFVPDVNAWTECLKGCDLGDGFCLCATENFIYAFGGRSTGSRGTRYSPESNCWNMIAPMKIRRNRASAVMFNSKIYILGGRGDDGYNTHVESYNIDNNEWKIEIGMSEGSYGHTSIIHNGTIHVLGGYPNRNTLQVYDKEKKLWRIRSLKLNPERDLDFCFCTL